MILFPIFMFFHKLNIFLKPFLQFFNNFPFKNVQMFVLQSLQSTKNIHIFFGIEKFQLN